MPTPHSEPTYIGRILVAGEPLIDILAARGCHLTNAQKILDEHEGKPLAARVHEIYQHYRLMGTHPTSENVSYLPEPAPLKVPTVRHADTPSVEHPSPDPSLVAVLREEIDVLNSRLADAKREIIHLEQQNDQHIRHLASAAAKRDQLIAIGTRLQHENTDLRAFNRNLVAQHQQLGAERDRLSAGSDKLSRDLSEATEALRLCRAGLAEIQNIPKVPVPTSMCGHLHYHPDGHEQYVCTKPAKHEGDHNFSLDRTFLLNQSAAGSSVRTPPSADVEHPAHYGGADNVYEAIKVIDAWGLTFTLGNVVKYIARAGKKPDATRQSDLLKARWYLTHELDRGREK